MVMPASGRVPLSTAVREWASADTGATAVGVVAGIAVGEWLGTMISEYFGMESGWADVAGKAVGKGILSFVLFIIARRTSGYMRILLNGAVIGAIASSIGDVIAQLTVPGMLGFNTGSSNINGVTVKVSEAASNIGATTKVLTHI